MPLHDQLKQSDFFRSLPVFGGFVAQQRLISMMNHILGPAY